MRRGAGAGSCDIGLIAGPFRSLEGAESYHAPHAVRSWTARRCDSRIRVPHPLTKAPTTAIHVNTRCDDRRGRVKRSKSPRGVGRKSDGLRYWASFLSGPPLSKWYLVWIEGHCSASSFAHATVPLAPKATNISPQKAYPACGITLAVDPGHVRNIDLFLLPLGSSGGSFVSVRRLRNGNDPRRSSRVA